MTIQQEKKTNVLLMGGGGREHAIAWKLAQSPGLGAMWTTHPGNPGVAEFARPVDVPVDIKQAYRLQQFCDKHEIGLVVIGPEDPLAEGWADALATPERLVFGPSKDAAQLEADKAWAKQMMRAAMVPTAEGRAFTSAEEAKAYLETRDEPQVIKASGLAKGKGVIVAQSSGEAMEAIDRIMVQREFGDAGSTLIIEERLKGPEVSVFALVDGRHFLILDASQDHKRLGEGDTGPNTGGMGAYCPTPVIDGAIMERVQREVLVAIVDALRREGIEYRGVLYAGLMLTPAGPKVLEFNVRFGDPECQCLLPRMQGDLLEVFKATASGSLDRVDVEWDARSACCIVLASDGYPASPRTGDAISGLDEAGAIDRVTIFHAGTTRNEKGEIVTAGGRVLNVVGLGDTLEAARARALEACDLIEFSGKQLRRDIAWQAIGEAATS